MSPLLEPQRHDQGFTLAEVLIALLVTSLALGSVIVAVSLVTRFNHAVIAQRRATQPVEATVRGLADLVHSRGGMTGTLIGGRDGFTYACGEDKPCAYVLPRAQSLHLLYVSGGKSFPAWPLAEASPASAMQLEALILQDTRNQTVGVVRFETEQSADCVFDMISRICRDEGRQTKP